MQANKALKKINKNYQILQEIYTAINEYKTSDARECFLKYNVNDNALTHLEAQKKLLESENDALVMILEDKGILIKFNGEFNSYYI